MSEIYRNVFFVNETFSTGTGSKEVYYTSEARGNVKTLVDFFKKYDRTKDLLISCNECAKKEIKFIRKLGEKIEVSSQTFDNTHNRKYTRNEQAICPKCYRH